MLAELQRQMANAVHGDAAAFDAARADIRPAAIDTRKRLYLHRNTVRAGLVAVLRQAFPVTAAVLGEPAFEAAVTDFVRVAPPRRAVLSSYGTGFPDFLDAWPSAEAAGSVPPARLARLDWAAHAAYFAADCAALTGETLAAIEPGAQARLRFTPVPSAALLSVDPSAWALWRRHADPAELTLSGATVPVAALAWRNPLNRVCVRALTHGEAALLRRLFAGEALLPAAQAGNVADPNLELSSILAAVLAGGLFAADGLSFADEARPDG